MYDENEKIIDWSIEQENLLVEWCDIAQCYKWLNSCAYRKYSRMHSFFTIPTIVFSTLTGTASFAQFNFPIEAQIYTPYIIGSITLFVGVLSTIQQYLKVTELKENYRISTILWDKYARNIRIELTRNPKERMDAGNFLKLTRTEFDHLMESTPLIPNQVIKLFKEKFMGQEGSKQREIYNQLKKPDICDVLVSSENIRNKSLLIEADKKKKDTYQNKDLDNLKEEMIVDINIFNSKFAADIESNDYKQ
jgi:hypothetical protein